jgi:RNA polymerase sigma-70 factor, ECF subfamily
MNREEASRPSTVADMAAMGALLETHRPRLLVMLKRRMDPALSARLGPEDILSEAFLQAHRKWNAFKAQTAMTPYAWLYRIVLDCLIEAWRKETRALRDPDREMPWPERSSIQLGLSLVHPGTSPTEAVVREEVRQHVRQALELLGSRDQEILWMRHFDELSFAEAAAVLDITENAATVRYVRALRRLKNLWEKLHHDKGAG